jgi:hypothetical protein
MGKMFLNEKTSMALCWTTPWSITEISTPLLCLGRVLISVTPAHGLLLYTKCPALRQEQILLDEVQSRYNRNFLPLLYNFELAH